MEEYCEKMHIERKSVDELLDVHEFYKNFYIEDNIDVCLNFFPIGF